MDSEPIVKATICHVKQAPLKGFETLYYYPTAAMVYQYMRTYDRTHLRWPKRPVEVHGHCVESTKYSKARRVELDIGEAFEQSNQTEPLPGLPTAECHSSETGIPTVFSKDLTGMNP